MKSTLIKIQFDGFTENTWVAEDNLKDVESLINNEKRSYTVLDQGDVELFANVEDTEIEEYRFEVEHEHNGRLNGFALTETKVKAKSFEEAIEKVRKNFKKIYDISEA